MLQTENYYCCLPHEKTFDTLIEDSDEEPQPDQDDGHKNDDNNGATVKGFTNIEVEYDDCMTDAADGMEHGRQSSSFVVLLLLKRYKFWIFGILIFLLGMVVGMCSSGKCQPRRSSSASESMVFSPSDKNSSAKTTTPIVEEENAKWAIPGAGGENVIHDKKNDEATISSSNSPLSSISSYAELLLILEDGNRNSNVIIKFNSLIHTVDEIQQITDTIFNLQQNNEMGMERYVIFFEPGIYGTVTQPLMIQIGYYTEVIGLGTNPKDVIIYGKIEVYNRCFEPAPYETGKFISTSNTETGLCFALNSFWRGVSNLSIRIVSKNQNQCRSTAMFWAISQASSMRRIHLEGGDISLMDYCSHPGYASGGYISDSVFSHNIISGSQQQFIMKNSNIVGKWDGAVWNQMFIGVVGAPSDDIYPSPPFTTMSTNPISREKPYLFVNTDNVNSYYVCIPSLLAISIGVSWANSHNGNNDVGDGCGGNILSVTEHFFVIDPTNGISVQQINNQLKIGKNLLFLPGVYDITESIYIQNANTIVVGLGLATLTAINGSIPIQTSNEPGIVIAGITIDAGDILSPVLMRIGNKKDSEILNNNIIEGGEDATNPITLSDIYFRVGGPHIGRVDTCLEINSNHVLVDHVWIWRADHGIENFNTFDGFEGDTERWRTNIGLYGIVVNGDDVTATGIFVEHFQKYNLLWNGERGRVYFFQNELPYDPPAQEDWDNNDGTTSSSGHAAYKVNNNVKEHEIWCGGVYCYNRNNPTIMTTNGFEGPTTALQVEGGSEGVRFNRIYTRNLSGPGIIQSVVNGVGETVNGIQIGPSYIKTYPQNK